MLSNNDGAGFRKGLALAALGAVVMSACDADREDFISPIGDVILDFSIGAGPGGLPASSGAIDEFALLGFDPTADPDAFARASGGLSGGYSSTASRFGGGWNFTGSERDSRTDPRLPALTEDDITINFSAPDRGIVLGDPQVSGLAGHNAFIDGSISGLNPNSEYVVAFFRYGIQVNGALDAEQVLLGDPVDQPDQLVPVGGMPSGDPAVLIEAFPTIVPGPAADANPYILGHFTTDATGEGFFDVVPSIEASPGDTVLYADGSGDPPDAAFDMSLVARNDGTVTTFPRYNYLVIIERQGAVTAADAADNPQAFRVQIAQDFDATGTAMEPNAFAPFPAGPATDAELLAGPGGFGQASGITFSATNLAPLSGVYQVWLLNEETGEISSVTGDVTITNVDELGMEVIVSQSTGNTFNTTEESDVATFVTSDAINGAPIGNNTHIFVSIEGSAAGTPSEAQPLWGQFTDMMGTPEDAPAWTFIEEFPVAFGTFDLGEDEQAYITTGFGQGAFTGAEFGTADLFRARFRNLWRPPVGYFYEGFLRRIEDGDVVADVSTGDLTTEFAEGFASLRDVDIDPTISTLIGPFQIIESANRATLAEVGSPFETFDDYVLRLRPKTAAGATSGGEVLQGTLPETLKAREVVPED